MAKFDPKKGTAVKKTMGICDNGAGVHGRHMRDFANVSIESILKTARDDDPTSCFIVVFQLFFSTHVPVKQLIHLVTRKHAVRESHAYTLTTRL